MKVLFAGPSLYRSAANTADIIVRPPAAHGDITEAVLSGAKVIGLVDGCFESVAAVWHKEILYALSKGIRVMGAASLGALRAAECADFGMEPIGDIARRYVTGALNDDAAVAQLHGPMEMGFAPLTETLVDAEAAVQELRATRKISEQEMARILDTARSLFFKNRTLKRLIFGAIDNDPVRAEELFHLYKKRGISLKQQDALQLVTRMKQADPHHQEQDLNWHLSEPQIWRRMLIFVSKNRREDRFVSTAAQIYNGSVTAPQIKSKMLQKQ